MNKLAVCAGCLLVVASMVTGVQARTLDPGSIRVSGDTSLGFTSQELDFDVAGIKETTIDTTTLSLSGAYYVIPNLGVGLRWFYEKTTTDDGTFESENTFSTFGPLVEYDLSIAEPVNVFASAELGWAFLNDTQDVVGGEEELDGNGFYWALAGGVRYFFFENVTLDGTLRYLSTTLDMDFDSPGLPSTSFDVDVTELSVLVGLSVYFGL